MTKIKKDKYNGGYMQDQEKVKQLYNFAYNCQPDAITEHYNDVVNIFNDDGMTPLMRASYNGNIDCVKNLLKLKNIDINLTDDKNRSSIFLAQFNGKIEVVNLLLSHNARIDMIMNEESTATEKSNYKRVIEELKNQKTRLFYSNLLFETITDEKQNENNKINIITKIIKKYPGFVNMPNGDGIPPILYAAMFSDKIPYEYKDNNVYDAYLKYPKIVLFLLSLPNIIIPEEYPDDNPLNIYIKNIKNIKNAETNKIGGKRSRKRKTKKTKSKKTRKTRRSRR